VSVLSRRAAAVIATGALALGACSDDGPSASEALPTPGPASFGEGAFDDVPVFRGASALQAPTVTDGVVAASYETDTARPETVLRFYAEELPGLGWEATNAPSPTGNQGWRGDWVRDGRRLEVSAVALPTENATDATRSQFSLILHPDLESAPAPTSP
jgi:hypothetical protein